VPTRCYSDVSREHKLEGVEYMHTTTTEIYTLPLQDAIPTYQDGELRERVEVASRMAAIADRRELGMEATIVWGLSLEGC